MNVLVVLVLVGVTEMVAWWVRRNLSALHSSIELPMHDAHVSDRTLVIWAIRLAGLVLLLIYLVHIPAAHVAA